METLSENKADFQNQAMVTKSNSYSTVNPQEMVGAFSTLGGLQLLLETHVVAVAGLGHHPPVLLPNLSQLLLTLL